MSPTARGAVGAGIGALQTPLIREFVDRKYPLINVPALQGFGTPSALAGIGIGGVATLVAAISLRGRGRKIVSDRNIPLVLDYGIVALTTGILSGIFPAVQLADCTTAGGYYYNRACHKTAPTGTVSMTMPGGGPYVPSVRYMPPPHATPSRFNPGSNVMEQMSSEVQRLSSAVQTLSHENAQLRAMAGEVSGLQGSYGFMADRTYPGQPTPAARRFGFMQPGQPTRKDRGFGFMDYPIGKVQSMTERFGFLG